VVLTRVKQKSRSFKTSFIDGDDSIAVRAGLEALAPLKQLGILLFLRLVPEGLKGFELWDETQIFTAACCFFRSDQSLNG